MNTRDSMNRGDAIKALELVGNRLASAGVTDTIRIVIGGGVAAMVVGDLPPSRVTHDCDVMKLAPEQKWGDVHRAAIEVAGEQGLGRDWLNCDSRKYAHLLPLGWERRCKRLDRFGPLEVLSLGRRDLIALKIIGAPKRPQDLDDVQRMKPTATELDSVREHLARLEDESLDRETYDAQQSIINELEAEL